MRNIQPKLGTREFHRTASKTAARLCVNRMPHATNAAEIAAATQNTLRPMIGSLGLSTATHPFCSA
jgi:hypothetical protein